MITVFLDLSQQNQIQTHFCTSLLLTIRQSKKDVNRSAKKFTILLSDYALFLHLHTFAAWNEFHTFKMYLTFESQFLHFYQSNWIYPPTEFLVCNVRLRHMLILGVIQIKLDIPIGKLFSARWFQPHKCHWKIAVIQLLQTKGFGKACVGFVDFRASLLQFRYSHVCDLWFWFWNNGKSSKKCGWWMK